MKSKLRIEFDFDKLEPYLYLELDTANPGEVMDVRDRMLHHFIEQANTHGLEIVYGESTTTNSQPQIRIKKTISK